MIFASIVSTLAAWAESAEALLVGLSHSGSEQHRLYDLKQSTEVHNSLKHSQFPSGLPVSPVIFAECELG